jgi:hypothetical protein
MNLDERVMVGLMEGAEGRAKTLDAFIGFLCGGELLLGVVSAAAGPQTALGAQREWLSVFRNRHRKRKVLTNATSAEGVQAAAFLAHALCSLRSSGPHVELFRNELSRLTATRGNGGCSSILRFRLSGAAPRIIYSAW